MKVTSRIRSQSLLRLHFFLALTISLFATFSIVQAAEITITAPPEAVIGETINLSAAVLPPGGTLQWAVVNEGRGAFTDPDSLDTQFTVEDRSLAFDGDDGPNIAIRVDYTVIEKSGETTVSALVQIPLDLDNPMIPYVREISFLTVGGDQGATNLAGVNGLSLMGVNSLNLAAVLPRPGQTVVFSAVVTAPRDDTVDSVTVDPPTFTIPADRNGIFLVPVTVSALINGNWLVTEKVLAVLTDIVHAVRIHLLTREFDLYCRLFPTSDFCDVWTKAKEHLFGPGGSGIKSDQMKEGWIGWANDTDVAIHLDGWEAIKAGLKVDRGLKGGNVERGATVTLKRVLVHEIRHVWQRWELAKGNPIPDGDAEIDARWFESKWAGWTLARIVTELIGEIRQLLENVTLQVQPLRTLLLTIPTGDGFTEEVQAEAVAELDGFVDGLPPTFEEIPRVLAALDIVFFDSATCDVHFDGQIDRDDIALIFGARGEPATSPHDPRDADRDGVITVNDGRACVLQCTNPRCAPSMN